MDFWDKVAFHTEALATSFADATVNAAEGVYTLVAEDAPSRAADYYQDAESSVGPFLATLTTPIAYLAHITVIPTGEAIGTGAAMAIYADNGEERAMGFATLFAGLCSAFGIVGGVFAPKPTITVPTFATFGTDGALAFGVVGVSVEAPAVGGIASAVTFNGGALFMANNNGAYAKPVQTKASFPAAKPPRTRVSPDQLLENIGREARAKLSDQTIKRLYCHDDVYTIEVVASTGGKEMGSSKLLIYDSNGYCFGRFDISASNEITFTEFALPL